MQLAAVLATTLLALTGTLSAINAATVFSHFTTIEGTGFTPVANSPLTSNGGPNGRFNDWFDGRHVTRVVLTTQSRAPAGMTVAHVFITWWWSKINIRRDRQQRSEHWFTEQTFSSWDVYNVLVMGSSKK